MSHLWCQKNTWTNADSLSIGPSGANFNEIWNKICNFHSTKHISKCCLKKWVILFRPPCVSHSFDMNHSMIMVSWPFPHYRAFVRESTSHWWIPPQRPVMRRSFGVFIGFSLNKLLSKQSGYQWFEMLTWRHCTGRLAPDSPTWLIRRGDRHSRPNSHP